jgi:pyruvate formate lyase activating enzyme
LYGETVDARTLAEKLAEDRAFFEASGGGVTISGGECLTQPIFVMELLRLLKANGLSVNIDTCGSVSWDTIAQTLPYTDVYLYDVKAIDPQVHLRCTGRDNTLILENLKRLSESGARIEIRYPFVKGWNDGEVEAVGAFLRELKGIVRVRVLPYHDFARSRYGALGKVDTMPKVKVEAADVEAAAEILREYGLPAVAN